MSKTEIKLKVAEAIQDDVNKGIVRIDTSYMNEIGIRPGDIVEIEGDRKTVAIADRAYPGDIGLNIIRVDGIIRKNARTGIGEFLLVHPADVKEAKKVVIAPARKGVIIRASTGIFKQGLLGRAVTKGDIVSLGGTRQRRSSLSESPFFDDVFNILDESMIGFGFGDIKFVVADVSPKQAVIITDATEVIFNPEAVDVEEEEIPEVTYEDIGGLEEEIKKIREMVELPLKHPEIFTQLGVDPPKGVLLHGPPGTGKTLLAKAVANETNSHFILINGPEVMSKYYGQSEENVRKKFEEAEKNAPSIVFIDEIDAIASKREETRGEVERRVVAQLLALMDGLQTRGKVVVIGATNVPNILDPALRRPGRFDREIEIGPPSKEGRLNVLKIHTRNMPVRPPYDHVVALEVLAAQKRRIEKKIGAAKTEETLKLQERLKRIEDATLTLENMNRSLDDQSDFDLSKKSLTQVKELVLQYMKHKVEKSKDAEVVKEFEVIKDSKDLTKKITSKNGSVVKNFLEERGMQSFLIAETIDKEMLDKVIETIDDTEIKQKIQTIAGRKLTEEEKQKRLWNVLKQADSETANEAEQKAKEDTLRRIANITHGFVGADLASLAKESAMIVLRKILPDIREHEGKEIPQEILEKLYIREKDLRETLKVVRPSAMREVLVEVPNVEWSDVGGLEGIKQELKEVVEWPIKFPDAFRRLGITPPKGVLLYGPPGTGKTLLAKAVANESQANFILVKGPELFSKWVGESEKAVRKVFEKARQTAPTIVFFDELDALAPSRGGSGDSNVTERVVNQLLTEIDGLEDLHDVVIIGATNRPDIVDMSLLRPGRFDRVMLVPSPSAKEREEVFKVHTKNMPLESSIKIDELAKETDGYTGSDIESVCREAAIFALRSDIQSTKVKKKHFEEALKKVGPSVTDEILELYKNFQSQFRQVKAKQMKAEVNYMG